MDFLHFKEKNMEQEIQVGFLRDFSFKPNKQFEVKEIIQNPNIEMEWNWKNSLCPHCNKMIVNTIKHKFNKIEILTDIKVTEADLKQEDIVVLGFTEDKKCMLLTREKINEVFSKSEKFKDFETK
jgi:hypothetical protein